MIGIRLNRIFYREFNSRKADYNGPPRSSDLTPLDIFHWGDVKDKVHADAPQSIQGLNYFIRRQMRRKIFFVVSYRFIVAKRAESFVTHPYNSEGKYAVKNIELTNFFAIATKF